MSLTADKLALVLGGGGARGAYQAGFLRGIAREFPDVEFPILTGVSAGGINAAHLATCVESFPEAAERLAAMWQTLTVDQVLRSDPLNLGSHMVRWALRLVSGGSTLAPTTHGMVNSDPLRDFLRRAFHAPDGRLQGIEENLRRGRLAAVGITTTDYTSGQAVTWIQGRDFHPWDRPGRRSQPATLTVDHILASASLPVFFPAIKIGPHWHGDGGVQLVAPLSPALYLGAGRILAISNRHVPAADEAGDEVDAAYPPPARIVGLMLRAIFLDMLDYDARVLERINDLVRDHPRAAQTDLRPVGFLLVRPSQDLSQVANAFEGELPFALRFALRGLGTNQHKRAELLATLLFQPAYIRRLLEIGEADARARRVELAALFGDRAAPRAELGR